MKKFRVLITGGGSGGHIYPLVAVVSELQILAAQNAIDLRVSYLGSYGPYKSLLEANNIKVHAVALSKIRRYFSLANLWAIPKALFGFIQALWWIFWIMPDVLFSKGGPGSLPVVFAARFYRIPVVVHESDSVAGLSNKIAGKHAKVVALSFATAQKDFRTNTVLVGNPVRSSILPKQNDIDQTIAKQMLGFDSSKPLIFVTGGSQGAVRVNNFIINNLSYFLDIAQVFHQTGRDNYETVLAQVNKIAADLPEDEIASYKAVDYLERDTKTSYIAADLVIARAGAGNIFEISAFGKPSILIPLPEAAGDHQRLNAYEYASSGASIVYEEENLLPNMVLNKIQELFEDRSKLQAMSDAAKKFYKPNAALDLAKIVLGFYK